MVRATRGASAIGRGAREQVIAKFDLAWKNHFITQILTEDGFDTIIDRRGPSSTLAIPAVVGTLDPPLVGTGHTSTSTTSSTASSGSMLDDGSKGQEWTPEGEERTAMRREWRDVICLSPYPLTLVSFS
jgi:hypothetical protein